MLAEDITSAHLGGIVRVDVDQDTIAMGKLIGYQHTATTETDAEFADGSKLQRTWVETELTIEHLGTITVNGKHETHIRRR